MLMGLLSEKEHQKYEQINGINIYLLMIESKTQNKWTRRTETES